MCLDLQGRGGDTLAGIRSAELGVGDAPAVAAGPTVVRTFMHQPKRVRREVVSQEISAVVGGPHLAGLRVPGEAHRVAQAAGEEALAGSRGAIIGNDGSPPPILLLADIAAGTDGYEHSFVRQEEDSAGVVSAGRVVVDECLALLGLAVLVLVLQSNDA